MSRIAVKIFLTFWLTFFVVAVGFSVMLQVLGSQEPAQPLGEFHRRQLEQHQTQIQTIARNRGIQGLRRFTQDVETNRGITVFLLAEDGTDILKRDVPMVVSSFVASNRDTGVPLMQMRERRTLLGPVALTTVDPPARLVLWLPMAASDISPLERWWAGRYAAAQLGVGLLLSGFISLALSLTLTRPLNRLERAASRLAQSHFDTRDIDAVAMRKDEIGSLAKEFAHMARHDCIKKARRHQRQLRNENRQQHNQHLPSFLSISKGLFHASSPSKTKGSNRSLQFSFPSQSLL